MGELFPEISGLELDQALKIIDSKQYQLILTESRPHYNKKGQGKKRVITYRKTRSEEIVIIWSYEKYE